MHTSVSARPATQAFPLALAVLALGVMAVMPHWQRVAAAPLAFASAGDTAAPARAAASAAGTMLPYGVFPGHAVTSSQHVLPYGAP
jgi:hypothetical protein